MGDSLDCLALYLLLIAILGYLRRVAAAATIAAERRRRQEATSEEVRLARAANPPISREDLHPHLRGQ